MMCFKCAGPGAKLRKRRHSCSPEPGRVALCGGCVPARGARAGNPAYWEFMTKLGRRVGR